MWLRRIMEKSRDKDMSDEQKKKYKAKHTVSTGEFSNFEFEVEATMEEIVQQANWLREQFKGIPKRS